MENIRQWHIIYTKEGYEQKVCELLRRKKLESFFASNKIVKTIYGKAKISYKPILEKLVFVNITPDEYNIVKHINGVVNFVYWINKPVVLKNEDIYMMKRFLNTYTNIASKKIKVNVQDLITVANMYDASENTEVVTIDFPAIGYAMSAPEIKTNIKVITLSDHQSKANNINKYAEAR